MTEEERRNRNPAVEALRFVAEEHPAVTGSELELHRVYVLQSARFAATLNYVGHDCAFNLGSREFVDLHHFHGPRVNIDVFLRAMPDGSFQDAKGHRVTVRRWTGPDA